MSWINDMPYSYSLREAWYAKYYWEARIFIIRMERITGNSTFVRGRRGREDQAIKAAASLLKHTGLGNDESLQCSFYLYDVWPRFRGGGMTPGWWDKLITGGWYQAAAMILLERVDRDHALD